MEFRLTVAIAMAFVVIAAPATCRCSWHGSIALAQSPRKGSQLGDNEALVDAYLRAAHSEVPENGNIKDNAIFVKIVVPREVRAGQSVRVVIAVQNTGTTVWKRANPHYYALGCGEGIRFKSKPPALRIAEQKHPKASNDDERNRIMLAPDESVKPGQTKNFECTLKAPRNLGHHALVWQMVIEGGKAHGWKDGWFGRPVVTWITNVK